MKSPIRCFEKPDLLTLIEEKKTILSNQVNEYGFTHQSTLAASHELDQLIYRYQISNYSHDQSRYSI